MTSHIMAEIFLWISCALLLLVGAFEFNRKQYKIAVLLGIDTVIIMEIIKRHLIWY